MAGISTHRPETKKGPAPRPSRCGAFLSDHRRSKRPAVSAARPQWRGHDPLTCVCNGTLLVYRYRRPGVFTPSCAYSSFAEIRCRPSKCVAGQSAAAEMNLFGVRREGLASRTDDPACRVIIAGRVRSSGLIAATRTATRTSRGGTRPSMPARIGAPRRRRRDLWPRGQCGPARPRRDHQTSNFMASPETTHQPAHTGQKMRQHIHPSRTKKARLRGCGADLCEAFDRVAEQTDPTDETGFGIRPVADAGPSSGARLVGDSPNDRTESNSRPSAQSTPPRVW